MNKTLEKVIIYPLIATSLVLASTSCQNNNQSGKIPDKVTQTDNSYDKALKTAQDPGSIFTGNAIKENKQRYRNFVLDPEDVEKMPTSQVPETYPIRNYNKNHIFGTQVVNKESPRDYIDLCTTNRKTKKEKMLKHTPDLYESFPSISPNGKKIAFIGNIWDKDEKRLCCGALYTCKTNGENIEKIVDLYGWGEAAAAEWSKDGKNLFFYQVNETKGGWERYIVNLKTRKISYIKNIGNTAQSTVDWQLNRIGL